MNLETLQKGTAPGKFSVMRDWALETGDEKGVLYAERCRELWERAPEEWEWARAQRIGEVAHVRIDVSYQMAHAMGRQQLERHIANLVVEASLELERHGVDRRHIKLREFEHSINAASMTGFVYGTVSRVV